MISTAGTRVELIDVHKIYRTAAGEVAALAGVRASFAAGTFTAVMGPSGSGKSTLLHCAAGLDRVTTGDVRIGGVNIAVMSDRQLTRLRRDTIGFVFQAFNLIPALTARQNAELSGGQQQRVAIARALVTRPGVVFADEPTGALDLAASHEVLGLLRRLVDESGITVVMVTHDPRGASRADRTLFLADGRVVAEAGQLDAAAVAERLVAPEATV